MAKRAEMDLTLSAGTKQQGDAPADEEQPLRFLVLGDFSRRTSPPDTLKSHWVTFDTFDEVLLQVSGRYGSLDQFHPDFLVESQPELQELVELRRRIGDPTTRAAALEQLGGLVGKRTSAEAPAVAQEPASPKADAPKEPEQDMLQRLLGGTRKAATKEPARTSSATASSAKAAVDKLVQQALKTSDMAPKAAPPDEAADARLLALMNERCRHALWAPEFRALERAWRNLHFLVSRLESEQGEVHVLDLSKSALVSQLREHGKDLDAAPLLQLLCQDEAGWDFIIGDYSFGLEAQDLMLIGNLGAIAARAGAPLLAQGELSLVGCMDESALDTPGLWKVDDPKLSELLAQVRAHPAAKWVGLAAPRFLLRHPYGRRTDPIDSFPFEELPAPPQREHFLWGNPAFACAWALGQAHTAGGARWPARQVNDILDLPMPQYNDGTGDAMQPPIEYLLNEAARVIAQQRGLIVFAGGSNQNRISTSMLHALASA